MDFNEQHNSDLKPFVWTKPVEKILEKVNRVPTVIQYHAAI